MPGLKKTTINASYFGNETLEEDSHHENTGVNFDGPAAGNDAGGSSHPTTAVHSRNGSTEIPKGADGQRKVILVQFEENDPEDPMHWSAARKWTVVALLNLMTLIIGLSTSAYSSGIGSMTTEFGVATIAGQVGMFTFNAACAVTPLFFAPLCELAGRRWIYIGAFGCFTVINIMLALGKNIGTEIVGRLLSGAFGSIGTILVGGTFTDIFSSADISVPMSIFTFSAIFSTIAAPTYAGYIDQYAGWRWIQWVSLIASGVLLAMEIIFLKEPRGAVILSRRAAALRKETGDDRYRSAMELETTSISQLFRDSSLRAFKLLFREPVVFLFGFWIAFAWGIVFLFLSAIPLAFQTNRGWSEGNSGLPYISLIIGCIIGFATGFWQDSMYNKAQAKNNGVAIPEARLYGAMLFGPLFPIGILIFAFTQYEFVHWIAPCIALVLIILGIYHIFLAVYSYTSDSYQDMASSAIAGQGFMRNMFAASFPLFATQMFNGMGQQFAGLLLALIGFCIAPLPFVLFKYGARIRASSHYASLNTGLKSKDGEAGEKGKAVDGDALEGRERKHNVEAKGQMAV